MVARVLPGQVGRFLVEIGAEVVADFQDCAGLTMEVEVLEVIEGGHNEYVHKLPGRVKYPNLTLKRGLTANRQFMAWRPSLEGGKLVVARKPVTIVLCSHAGLPIASWAIAEAYPVKWTGPELKAGSMEVAIETLELAHTGWRQF